MINSRAFVALEILHRKFTATIFWFEHKALITAAAPPYRTPQQLLHNRRGAAAAAATRADLPKPEHRSAPSFSVPADVYAANAAKCLCRNRRETPN